MQDGIETEEGLALAGLFEPIESDSVADAVVAQVEQLIVDGVLKSETKLPSERALAELLDVSRPKVRDAIKELENRGLLISRHGDGTFVAPLTCASLSPAMVELFARHPQAFADYLEFRREIEGYAAFLAAQRATATDRALIKRHLAEMEAAHSEADPAREAELDIALHTAIVDAAHNAMVGHVMASIYDLMSRGVFYNRNFLYGKADARDELLEQHRAVADAVVEGRAEDACAAAEAHIDFVRRSFETGAVEERRERIAQKRARAVLPSRPPAPSRPRRSS